MNRVMQAGTHHFVPNKDTWPSLLEISTKEVFELMVGAPLMPVASQEERQAPDITAMVGMAGKLCGVMSVRCAVSTGAKVASMMLGVQSSAMDENVRDAMGEICNMVAGNFKAKIAGLADGCMLSVPTVICGADYQVNSLGGGDRIESSLAFDGEPVWICLEINP